MLTSLVIFHHRDAEGTEEEKLQRLKILDFFLDGNYFYHSMQSNMRVDDRRLRANIYILLLLNIYMRTICVNKFIAVTSKLVNYHLTQLTLDN
jgi:hypothetical protein